MFRKCLDVLKWGGDREVCQGKGGFTSPGLCLYLVEDKPCSLMEKMILSNLYFPKMTLGVDE